MINMYSLRLNEDKIPYLCKEREVAYDGSCRMQTMPVQAGGKCWLPYCNRPGRCLELTIHLIGNTKEIPIGVMEYIRKTLRLSVFFSSLIKLTGLL